MSYKNPSRKQPPRLSTPVRLGVAAVAACFIGAPVLSNPLNPAVVNGTATFNQAGKVLTVTNTPGAIINWQKFSIQAGETTHFAQTSASSSVLNRVLNDPTAIYGTLSSNGRVWLVNPAGIMVGPGGKVDVAAFVASTLNISNADFLAGRSVFINDGTAKNVINQGEIRTPAGGSVYLIGSNVTNEGIITTPKGETILAAGNTVSLIDSATPGVKVDITGTEGNATNLGTLTAEAGRIGIAGVIVRNSGTVNASSVVSEGGRVFLKASQDAYVDRNGRIVTTGTRGGSVEVLGNRVAIMDKAEIDASGTNGGGRILVGGDYQGKNPDVQNATVTYFGSDAKLKADAKEVGDGGTVIVWADDTTRAYGNISARGGAAGGNGGFVETSGKRYLDTPGIRVDVGASNGQGGLWLLDPSNINIVASGTSDTIESPPGVFSYGGSVGTLVDDDINAALLGGDVIVQTDGFGGGTGHITATGVTISGAVAGNSLTLAAYGGIGGYSAGSITVTGSTINVNGGVTMLAGWDGSGFASTDVIPFTGDISISGSTIQSGSGAVNLWAGYNIEVYASGSSPTLIQGTSMDLRAGNAVTLEGGSVGGSVLIGSLSSSGAPVTIVAGNEVFIDGGDGGVGIGSIGPVLAAGEVYIASGSSVSAASGIYIDSQKSVSINGTVISTGTCGGDCNDGVFITAGYYSSGGDIKLGSQSVITGYSVALAAYGVSTGGNIIQDPGGVITIYGNYSGYSNFFMADGNLLLDGAVVASNLAGGGVYGYAGYSGAPGKLLRISNISSPTGGELGFHSSGDAAIGTIYAPTGHVDVNAGGAIYDNNGSALNITAADIVLVSEFGGAASGLAISMDTSATSSLIGYVAPGASFGGISIRNFGAQPGFVQIDDNAFSQSAINFFNSGDLTLDANKTFSTSPMGSTQIGSGGILSVTSGISGYDINLAGATIDVNGGYVYADNNIQMTAGTINVNGGYVFANNNVTMVTPLVGGTINLLGGGVEAYASSGTPSFINNIPFTGIGFVAQDLNGDSGGFMAAAGVNGNISGLVSGNVTLRNGAQLVAGDDITLVLSGSNSTVELMNGGKFLSDIDTGVLGTIYLDFLTRGSGGIIIDGEATTTSPSSTGSGFFVGYPPVPATPGNGLEITYGNDIVIDPCASSPDLCKPPVPVENPIIELTAADPCTAAPDSAQCKALKGEEQDKQEKDEFGEEDGKKDGKSSQKKLAQCGI